MKKLLALLLVVLTVFLVACGSEPEQPATQDPSNTVATPDEPTETEPITEPTTLANDRFDPEGSADLIGNWTTTITLDGSMFNLPDMEASVEMTMAYRLNGDGTYSRGVDPKEYREGIATYNAAVEQFMLDRLYDTFVAEKTIAGVSKKKIATLWENEEKASAEEQARRFVEGLYLDYRFSQINNSGDYYVENGFLWFSRDDGTYEPCGYELSENGLTILDVENPKPYNQLKLKFPLLLTKA